MYSFVTLVINCAFFVCPYHCPHEHTKRANKHHHANKTSHPRAITPTLLDLCQHFFPAVPKASHSQMSSIQPGRSIWAAGQSFGFSTTTSLTVPTTDKYKSVTR